MIDARFYRSFTEQEFVEIGFLATSQTQQVCGYGARLTGRTKARMKKLGLAFLLTIAEKNAVIYFEKQLFTKVITILFYRWQRYMKVYDGDNNGVYLALGGCLTFSNLVSRKIFRNSLEVI